MATTVILRNLATTDNAAEFLLSGNQLKLGGWTAVLPTTPGLFYVIAYADVGSIPHPNNRVLILSARQFHHDKSAKAMTARNGFTNIIAVYAHGENGDCALLINYSCKPKSTPPNVVLSADDSKLSNLDALAKYAAWVPTSRQMGAKERLLEQIVTNDSLAAMQLHIDLLTRIVEAMVLGQGAPAWAADLWSAVRPADLGDSVERKGVPASLAELGEYNRGLAALIIAYRAANQGE